MAEPTDAEIEDEGYPAAYPEPLAHAIAELRPCRFTVRKDCPAFPSAQCEGVCLGDGFRWVVPPDAPQVEPRDVVVPGGPTETWWRPTS